jgi:hypothetical protein
MSDEEIVWSGEDRGGGCPPYAQILRGGKQFGSILFQNGVEPLEINGTTNEQVIELLLQRLRRFNEGPFRCRENSLAITHLEEARFWLWERTRVRQEQAVEGKYEAHHS